jgi:hypothetical protein
MEAKVKDNKRGAGQLGVRERDDWIDTTCWKCNAFGVRIFSMDFHVARAELSWLDAPEHSQSAFLRHERQRVKLVLTVKERTSCMSEILLQDSTIENMN